MRAPRIRGLWQSPDPLPIHESPQASLVRSPAPRQGGKAPSPSDDVQTSGRHTPIQSPPIRQAIPGADAHARLTGPKDRSATSSGDTETCCSRRCLANPVRPFPRHRSSPIHRPKSGGTWCKQAGSHNDAPTWDVQFLNPKDSSFVCQLARFC